MARLTIEDCLEKVGNRFDLLILAAKRARDLARRSDKSQLPWDNDKPEVLALREIAAGLIGMDYLDAHKKPAQIASHAAEENEDTQDLLNNAVVAEDSDRINE